MDAPAVARRTEQMANNRSRWSAVVRDGQLCSEMTSVEAAAAGVGDDVFKPSYVPAGFLREPDFQVSVRRRYAQ